MFHYTPPPAAVSPNLNKAHHHVRHGPKDDTHGSASSCTSSSSSYISKEVDAPKKVSVPSGVHQPSSGAATWDASQRTHNTTTTTTSQPKVPPLPLTNIIHKQQSSGPCYVVSPSKSPVAKKTPEKKKPTPEKSFTTDVHCGSPLTKPCLSLLDDRTDFLLNDVTHEEHELLSEYRLWKKTNETQWLSNAFWRTNPPENFVIFR
jgi:hypothetical protein